MCGFATVSTTTTNLQWVSLSTRLSSSSVPSPPSSAKSLTRSWSSSASELVVDNRPSLITITSNSDTSSTFTTLASSTVFSYSNNDFFLSSESSKASEQKDPFQRSKRLASSEILLAVTTSRNSPPVSSTSNETPFGTTTFRSSYSHSSSRNASTISSQSCSLCTKSFCPGAACSYSSSRAHMRLNSDFESSVGPTSSTLLRSSASPSPTVSVSSTPTLAGFYELVPAGVTSYFDITATITSPPPGFTTLLASNTHWTGDTTTVSDGTTYPVIYGCAHCGGRHHGIVIEGLGGKSNDPKRPGCGSSILAMFRSMFGCGTEFNFPPLWGLPPFIIDPLGDPVTSAPETDPDPDPTGKPRSNGPSLSQASSTPTTSISASSTASCFPTSTPNLYAIFLVDRITDTEVVSLSTYLKEEVGGSDVVAAISLGTNGVASMFAALIDDCVASKINSHPSVGLLQFKEREVRLTSSGTDLFSG